MDQLTALLTSGVLLTPRKVPLLPSLQRAGSGRVVLKLSRRGQETAILIEEAVRERAMFLYLLLVRELNLPRG